MMAKKKKRAQYSPLSDEHIVKLASAILIIAMSDYEKALKQHKAKPEDKAQIGEIKKLERFFLSDYGQALSFYHGAMIIERCKSDVENGTCKQRGVYA